MSAWTELGTELGPTLSAGEAMKIGLLAGWNVRQVPMFATLPAVKGISRQVEVTDRVAVVRDSPHTPKQIDYLSIVSKSYTVVANEDCTPVLDQLAEESGSTFTTAGEVDSGRCAFLTMRLPGHMHGGVEVYVTALNDHGGYKPFTLLATPVDVVTGSVLAVFEVGRVRHTSGALEASHHVARAALDRTFNELDGFQATADQLADTPVSVPQFEQLVERNFGAGLSAPAATRTRNQKKVADIAEMFSDTEDRTAWSAFVTLADWYDHRSPVRGDTARAYKAVFDTGFKDQALRVMGAVS